MEQSQHCEVVRRSIGVLCFIGNTSSGLTHPYDESRTKELFKALRDHQILFSYDLVESTLLDHGLNERQAHNIAELAQNISQGKRVVVNHPRDWGEQTVQRIIAEMKNESSSS